MRHAIEHVPDFAPAMEHSLALAGHLAIFACFLSPRSFPIGIPKVNPRIEPPFCTCAYSRAVIERFLTLRGVEFCWKDGAGGSRSGFLAGETNTILMARATHHGFDIRLPLATILGLTIAI
jgi:hypothetical protein